MNEFEQQVAEALEDLLYGNVENPNTASKILAPRVAAAIEEASIGDYNIDGTKQLALRALRGVTEV